MKKVAYVVLPCDGGDRARLCAIYVCTLPNDPPYPFPWSFHCPTQAREMGDNLPVVDLGINTVQEVAAGQSHTCALLTSGNVSCWGYNAYGQAGGAGWLGLGVA